uniref:Uncharacterized protein n=1 Tax=Amphimedon queenslandica TaxID=400682 RepID=A0A1X7TEC9_AMPQE
AKFNCIPLVSRDEKWQLSDDCITKLATTAETREIYDDP